MKIYGFTILRNGVKYDYPFRESIESLCSLCDRVYLGLGNSDDGTEKMLSGLANLTTIPSIWDESIRKSGLILSQQTNIALKELRKEQKSGWAFYLQADELIHNDDREKIISDLSLAEKEGCDSVSFRYLHFWQSYDHIAIAKRWYPQEIRAIKVNSDIESYGDAQSFRHCKKIFYSDVHIFHYGHVRELAAYEKKKAEFGRWWHNDIELKKVVEKGNKKDKKEEWLYYLGTHPKFIEKRKKASSTESLRNNIFQTGADEKREIVIFGNKEDFSIDIEAKAYWTKDWKKIFSTAKDNLILLCPPPWPLNFFLFFKTYSKVPKKMRSPQARTWDKNFWAMLKLSEKGISSSRRVCKGNQNTN